MPVVTKQLLGHVDNSAYPAGKVDIEMVLTTPANAPGPVSVFVEFPQVATTVLAKGWGHAILYPNTIQADNGQGLTQVGFP